jgi:hypothetical protein
MYVSKIDWICQIIFCMGVTGSPVFVCSSPKQRRNILDIVLTRSNYYSSGTVIISREEERSFRRHWRKQEQFVTSMPQKPKFQMEISTKKL